MNLRYLNEKLTKAVQEIYHAAAGPQRWSDGPALALALLTLKRAQGQLDKLDGAAHHVTVVLDLLERTDGAGFPEKLGRMSSDNANTLLHHLWELWYATERAQSN